MSPRHSLPLCFVVTSLAFTLLPAPVVAGGSHLRRNEIVDAIEKARPAVVNIHSERTSQATLSTDPVINAPQNNRSNGMGTGIIIDPRGYIVTNHHVVEDVSVIRCRLNDGSTFPAKVVTRDKESDLAIIKIDVPRTLPTIRIATSSDLMVGETVIAIGNAYGYEHTVSAGIISALGRDITLNKEVSYKSLIQTDASINPGNSGGPLLNIEGDLIGVNVAIRAGAQGIGFAIPVDQMVEAVAAMFSRRRQTEIAAGLVCRDRVALNQSPCRFLEVARVSGETERASLKQGDVILQVKDVSVTNSIDLERAMLDAKPGEKVPVRVRRGRAEQQLELTLNRSNTQPSVPELAWRQLGLRLGAAPAETFTRANANVRGGMLILEVNPGSPSARAGLQRGDVLVGLHQWETLNLENLGYVLSHEDLKSFFPLKFFVLRNGQMHKGWLQEE
jgi:serine protease Do